MSDVGIPTLGGSVPAVCGRPGTGEGEAGSQVGPDPLS